MTIDNEIMTPTTVPASFHDAPTVVRVQNASKRFTIRKDNSLKERIVTLGRAGRRHSEDFWALKDISLDIPAGTTIGLLGPNGSGKSTLLKMIGGILEPTSGSVEHRGRLAALIELGAGMHPDLTGRENVYLNAAIQGLTRDEAESKFDAILQFSGIGDFIDTQVKFYSSGMYVRLAFAVAINTDPDVLLVDEVLAVGDEQFQKKCLDKIREFQQQGRTIVLVSHSLGQVQELCDSAVVLHEGVIKYQGSARLAVKNFREILEGRRVAEAEAQHPEEDANPGKVERVDLEIVGKAPNADVRPGDNVRIKATFSHTTPLEHWHSGIKVENQFGHLVYGTDSRQLGVTHRPLHGRATVEYTLPNVQFGGGPYFVHVFMAKETGEHIVIQREAARLVVTDDDTQTGVARVAGALREVTD